MVKVALLVTSFLFLLVETGVEGARDDGIKLAEAQIAWLREAGGFYNPNISIQPILEAENAPLGLFAADSFSKGETLMIIPRNCLLTAGRSSEDMCDTALNLIREHKLKEESDFAPYVSYLFSKDSIPLPSSWSNLGKELILNIRGNKLPPKDLTSVSFENDCDGNGDELEEFAYLTVVSRAWTNKLVPVFDMINHQSGHFANVDSTRVHGPDDITVHATRDIEAGEQLFLSYMDCIDEIGYELTYVLPDLLRDFGFVDQYPQRWTFPGDGPGIVFDLDFENEQMRGLYESGVLKLPTMNITWHTHEPNDKEKTFLVEELHRLKELQSYVTDTANQLESAVERDTCLEYYQSLTLALASAIKFSKQADTCGAITDSDIDSPVDGRQSAQNPLYEDEGWDYLSYEARKAAAILGYNKESWNGNMIIDHDDTSWEDLSKEQIAAATALGYNRDSWDTAGEYHKRREKKKEARKWMACRDYERVPRDFQVTDSFRSHYQSIEVFYGKQEEDACLYLDDYLHTCASSRPHYHEVFVHYPARFIDEVKRVLYIGGGDSMVLHEVLKYPTLELVVGLELDQMVSRKAFKNFGTQPHWDNEKVQWWYGNAAESLLLLPNEYYGSFDLVIIDILTSVAKALKVNEELNIIDAAMLLMNSNGIIVKNEDEGYVPGSTSNYTDYSVDLLYHDVPLYCLQAFVVGSNAVNFLNTNPKDHAIETIYLGGLDKFRAHFDSWYNFGMETRRSISECQKKHYETAKESTKPLGVLMVLEAEDIMVPLDSETTIKSTITQALDNAGLQVIASTFLLRSHLNEVFTLVALVPQGYIVARFFSQLQYCAFDINLWGASAAKLDHVKSELIEAVQSKNPSSYRMITGGMLGVPNGGVKSLGPPSANMLCTNSKLNLTDAKIRNEKRADAFERPQATTLLDYNLTLPTVQWHSQAPVGAQTLMQFEVPPFMIGERVLVNQDGSFVPGTVVNVHDKGHYTVLTEDTNLFVSNLTASRIKKLLDSKLDRPFMYAFLKEILAYVHQSAQELMAADEDSPQNESYQDIGDGLAVVVVSSQYSIIAMWDGGSFIDFNLFLVYPAIDYPSLLFDTARNEKLAHWRLTRRDDFPRGLGSVVNFKSEIFHPPAWVVNKANETRLSNDESNTTVCTKESKLSLDTAPAEKLSNPRKILKLFQFGQTELN